MRHTPIPRPPIGVYVAAVVIGLGIVGAIVYGAARFWDYLTIWHPFWANALGIVAAAAIAVILASVAMAFSAGAAHLWARIVVYLRQNAMPLLEQQHQTEQIRAERSQGLPEAVQSLNINNKVTHAPALPAVVEGEVIVPQPEMKLLPGECAIAGLVRTNIIARSGNSMHMGNAVADNTPVYLEIAQWGALAMGGKSRTGKTARAIYCLCQAYINGWQMVICDKHGGGGKADALLQKIAPLSNGFLLPAAITREDIKLRIRQVAALGARRLSKADKTTFPIVLVIDELTNLILNDWLDQDDLDRVMSIGNEMAGVNIHALLIGHDWGAACLGKERGAALRRITTHRIAHKLDAQGAQFLLPAGMGKMAEQLQVGQAVYVDDTGEPVVLDCPYMRDEDIAWTAAHQGRWRGRPPTPPAISDTQPTADMRSAASGATPSADPGAWLSSELGVEGVVQGVVQNVVHHHPEPQNARVDQVRELLGKKASINDILASVWLLDPKKRDAAYRVAMDEYRDIVAAIARGGS